MKVNYIFTQEEKDSLIGLIEDSLKMGMNLDFRSMPSVFKPGEPKFKIFLIGRSRNFPNFKTEGYSIKDIMKDVSQMVEFKDEDFL